LLISIVIIKPTCDHLVVEGVDDGVALVPVLHASEAYTAAEAVWLSQDACRDDGAVVLEQAFQVLLREVHGQVGDVQVGRVLLLLLQHTKERTNIVLIKAEVKVKTTLFISKEQLIREFMCLIFFLFSSSWR
jgi:hypothetical protein